MLSQFLRHPLAHDLTLVIVVKILALALAAQFLFGPASRLHVDSATLARHLFAG
jgi:hypothetical protein